MDLYLQASISHENDPTFRFPADSPELCEVSDQRGLILSLRCEGGNLIPVWGDGRTRADLETAFQAAAQVPGANPLVAVLTFAVRLALVIATPGNPVPDPTPRP